VTLGSGLGTVLGKGSVAQGADTAETSPVRKLVVGGAPGELMVAAAMLWLSVLCKEKKKWKVSSGRRRRPASEKEGSGSPSRKRMEASALSLAVTSTAMACGEGERM
jgi:hypothetical protein